LRTCALIFLFAALALGQPQRIVSTVPGLTEILFALGLESRVAGVSEYCVFPPAAKGKPRIGNFLQPNLEKIASLRPDLVLIIKNPVRLRERLESLKLRVEEIDLESLDGILAGITRIGALTGKTREAAVLRASLETGLQRLRDRVRHRRSVVFLVGRTPQRLEGMVAVGPGSYLDTLLTAAGGINAFADAPTMYPKISIEQLLARQPEVLFEMGDSVHEGNAGDRYREDVLAVWAKLPSLGAVKNRRVYPLNDGLFVVPGPRFLEAAERLYEMLEGRKP
jgi:iron complex transport system substrate-binding protein